MAGIVSLILFGLVCKFVLPTPHTPDGALLAFWQMAIPLALGLGSSLLAGRKGGPVPGDREFTAQSARDATRGGAAEDAYFNYLNNYDASKSAERTAGALSEQWLKKFRREGESLLGDQVARGRLDTGYGMEDQDRYVRDFNTDVGNSLAALAMDTERMNYGAKADLGRYGERVTGRGLDLTATRRDQALTDRASRRAMYGQLGGSLINAGGQIGGAWLANKAARDEARDESMRAAGREMFRGNLDPLKRVYGAGTG